MTMRDLRVVVHQHGLGDFDDDTVRADIVAGDRAAKTRR